MVLLSSLTIQRILFEEVENGRTIMEGGDGEKVGVSLRYDIQRCCQS